MGLLPLVKLIDFGCATRFVGVTLTSRVGTPYTSGLSFFCIHFYDEFDVVHYLRFELSLYQ